MNEEELVQFWLDTEHVSTLLLQYQQTIRDDMLTNRILNSDFKHALESVDLTKKVFTADLGYCYFTALIQGLSKLDTSTCEWFLSLGQDVLIQVIDPIDSVADKGFSQIDELYQSGAQFSIPLYNSSVVAQTAQKILAALTRLEPLKETCVSSHLLNSISIFAGNDETATSGVFGSAPGRIFIREVTASYPDFYYLDMMMHEISHLYFNLIATFHPLISDYTKHFFSVAKNTDRPIFGIYNATFVLYRLITLYPLVEPLLRQSEQALTAEMRLEDFLYHRFFRIPFNYDLRLALYHMKFNVACEQLLMSDALTTIGRTLLLTMKRMVTQSIAQHDP